MKERLFFDGVDILRDHTVVNQRVQGPGPVFPDLADADASGWDETAMRAKVAYHRVERRLLV
jgi:hypothetical protein